MVKWHKSVKKKISGGKKRRSRDKRKREMGRAPALTKVAEEDLVRQVHIAGNKFKNRALGLSNVNVLDPETNKVTKAKIKKVKLG